MKRAEYLLAILSIIALGLNLFFIPGSGFLTVFSLLMLSMLYCYLSFALFNDIRLRKIFKRNSYIDVSSLRILGAVCAGLTLSTTTIGLMFKFQSLPGAHFLLGAGLFGLLIVTFVGLIKYAKNKSSYYAGIFKRITIVGGLGLILMMTPKSIWIEIKYRNQPEYVDALKKAMADPDNRVLWDEIEQVRKKMNNYRKDN
jgi:hypothetical protein